MRQRIIPYNKTSEMLFTNEESLIYLLREKEMHCWKKNHNILTVLQLCSFYVNCILLTEHKLTSSFMLYTATHAVAIHRWHN